jgi:hypothetical protein
MGVVWPPPWSNQGGRATSKPFGGGFGHLQMANGVAVATTNFILFYFLNLLFVFLKKLLENIKMTLIPPEKMAGSDGVAELKNFETWRGYIINF